MLQFYLLLFFTEIKSYYIIDSSYGEMRYLEIFIRLVPKDKFLERKKNVLFQTKNFLALLNFWDLVNTVVRSVVKTK